MNTVPTLSPSADTGHCLAWAIKRSLVAYVQRTPDGQVWVGDGVKVNAAGEFLFPFDPDRSGPDGEAPIGFRGEVALTAHWGMLHLLVADPRLEADGALTVRISEAGSDNNVRVQLAVLASGGDSPSDDDSRRCVLSAAGAELFGGMYVAGQDLAPIAAHLPSPWRVPEPASSLKGSAGFHGDKP